MIGPVFIRGVPKGQPRVRAFVRGRHAGVYDPGTADDWKATVQLALRGMRFADDLRAPVAVSMVFYFPRPKSHRTSKGVLKPTAPTRHTSKPDADNLSKAVLDVMVNMDGLADDAQVVDLRVQKFYENGRGSGMELTVTQEQQA